MDRQFQSCFLIGVFCDKRLHINIRRGPGTAEFFCINIQCTNIRTDGEFDRSCWGLAIRVCLIPFERGKDSRGKITRPECLIRVDGQRGVHLREGVSIRNRRLEGTIPGIFQFHIITDICSHVHACYRVGIFTIFSIFCYRNIARAIAEPDRIGSDIQRTGGRTGKELDGPSRQLSGRSRIPAELTGHRNEPVI